MSDRSQGTRIVDAPLQSAKASSYQQISSATLAAATLLTVPDGANSALIQAEGQDVRWTDDGSTPTSAIGMLLKANSTMSYSGPMSAFQAIRTTAGSILNVSYYK